MVEMVGGKSSITIGYTHDENVNGKIIGNVVAGLSVYSNNM